MSLDEARKRAETLRLALIGEYRINARHMGRHIPREGLLELPNVSVRLAVSFYIYGKIKEVLGRYSTEQAVAEFRALVMKNLDLGLEMGQQEGGNVIISWYSEPEIWGFRRWSPQNESKRDL
jgi:hypothetical protein